LLEISSNVHFSKLPQKKFVPGSNCNQVKTSKMSREIGLN
jgi:hypothetical protein